MTWNVAVGSCQLPESCGDWLGGMQWGRGHGVGAGHCQQGHPLQPGELSCSRSFLSCYRSPHDPCMPWKLALCARPHCSFGPVIRRPAACATCCVTAGHSALPATHVSCFARPVVFARGWCRNPVRSSTIDSVVNTWPLTTGYSCFPADGCLDKASRADTLAQFGAAPLITVCVRHAKCRICEGETRKSLSGRLRVMSTMLLGFPSCSSAATHPGVSLRHTFIILLIFYLSGRSARILRWGRSG